MFRAGEAARADIGGVGFGGGRDQRRQFRIAFDEARGERGKDAEHIVGLHRNGHEIGCHSFSHRRAIELDADEMAAEIEQNRRYFQTASGG